MLRCCRHAAAVALFALPLPALANCQVGKIIDLPVTLHGMQPLVDATLNGRAVRLMIDSGAFYSLLSPGVAAELALPRKDLPFGYRVSGIGGDAEMSIGTVKDFTVSGATLHHLEFLVGGSEIGAAGVLGQNILGFRDAEYDLGGGMVRLMATHGCEHANLAYWAKDRPVAVVPLTPSTPISRHMIGTVTVNGVAMRAEFDTGAASTMITQAAAARAGVRVDGPGVAAVGFSSGIGRRLVQSWTGRFRTLDIGGEEIRNAQLRISRVDNLPVDMLIGADFFLSHHVFVANGFGRMFITYEGGPVFRLPDLREAQADAAAPTPAAATSLGDAAAEPTDAAGFSRRGAARLARRDLQGALSDLDHAVAAAPDDPRYRIERGRLHLVLRQPLLAAADLDAALARAPDDIEARLLRANLRLRANDRAGAREDADAAAAHVSRQADERFALAGLYSRLDRPDEAIAQYDLWIAAHPDDARRPTALNGRCWARALAARELPQALSDCDAALRRAPNDAEFLDSRGLVHLRMGDYPKAIADYDRALAAAPLLAFSLYGRGLARIASGDTAGGRADLAAAEKLDPQVPVRARRYGLAPPG